jgi:hypothetical protein
MKQRIQTRIPHITAYTVGMIIAAFGIFLMKNSELGLGPWGVAALELQYLFQPIFPWFTFGMASAVHTYSMLFLILIVQRKLKTTFVFFSIFFLNAMVDTFDLVIFPGFDVTSTIQGIGVHSLGFFGYVFGTSWIILSGIPGMVLEEFTFAMMTLFKGKSYSYYRVFVSYFAYVLAIIYGLISGTNATSITILSFFLGVAFGPAIAGMVQVLKRSSLPKRFHLIKA